MREDRFKKFFADLDTFLAYPGIRFVHSGITIMRPFLLRTKSSTSVSTMKNGKRTAMGELVASGMAMSIFSWGFDKTSGGEGIGLAIALAGRASAYIVNRCRVPRNPVSRNPQS